MQNNSEIGKFAATMQFKNKDMNRCEWATTDPLLQKYHDEEWGIPVHDDREHYMYMLMESMSCGLSWLLMLKKREIFRACFANFNYEKRGTIHLQRRGADNEYGKHDTESTQD